MKFKIKRLTALVSLALVAAGSASAGNLCGMGLPGMGCGNTSGMADSTQNTWVGAQSPDVWQPPPQQNDQTTQALAQYQAGALPLIYSGSNPNLPTGWEAVENMGYYPGANNNYYNLLMSSGNADGTNWLVYNAATRQYGVWQIVTPHG